MLEGSILHRLRDAHQSGESGKRPLNFGVYYKNTLVALCHALEDSILTTPECSPLMITAFQRGKWYLQEADRYGDIAERAQQVVILASPDSGFAEHPTSQRSNVNLVGLAPEDPVAQEWHLIIVSPDYTAMVLCQELSEADYGPKGIPQDDLARKFYGFWTFEPSLVIETAQIAIEHIAQYDPALQATVAARLQAIAQQVQHTDAPCSTPTAAHLGDVVARVIDYLDNSQQALPQSISISAPGTYTGLDTNLLSNELQAFLRIAQLMDQTDLNNPMAGAEVASLAEAMGQLLDLPAWQMHRLRLGGLLHRLAFLPSDDVVLDVDSPTPSQTAVPLSCSLVPGVQVLRKMPRLRAIATILTHQAEWWNGRGRPSGLAGDAIPLESRILGLVTYFQAQVAELHLQRSSEGTGLECSECLTEALARCEREAGDRWDPKLVEILALLVSGLSQGLSLSVALPKISAGLWMVDSHSEDEALISYPSALA